MYLQSSKGLRLHADKKSVLGKIKILTSLLPVSSNFDGFTRKVCQSKDRGRLETDVITMLHSITVLQCYSVTVLQCYSVTSWYVGTSQEGIFHKHI